MHRKANIKRKGGVALLEKQRISVHDDDVLHTALENGIIDMEVLRSTIETMERQEIIKQHPYSIWQNKEGMWLTHLQNSKGKKIIRRRKTRRELEDMLVDYYRNQEKELYIKDVFEEWSSERLKYGEVKKQSYDRYCSDYKRFFKPTLSICRKKFKNITEQDLEDFIKCSIHDLGLTRKTYSGLVTLLNGIFRYGKKKGYTTISITSFIGDLQLSNNIFAKKFKSKETEVFMEEEIPIIISYLKNNADIWNLGLLLQFQTGLRVGELAALQRQDLRSQSIMVMRTEVKYKDDNGKWKVKVVEIPKTDAGYRQVILPKTAEWTIEQILKINPNGEYLFMNNGKRIRENTFNKRLSSVCEKLGLLHRTSHKVRKTYGTTLLDNDVDDSFVAEQMGHTDVATTRKLYYYSNKSMKSKIEQIENAVNF